MLAEIGIPLRFTKDRHLQSSVLVSGIKKPQNDNGKTNKMDLYILK